MNIPYVKQYDPATGECINPIVNSYQSRTMVRTELGKVFAYPNRMTRRNAHKRDKHGMVPQLVPYYVDANGDKLPYNFPLGVAHPLTLKFKTIYHKKPYLA